jgi:hypothetical protein
MDRGFYRKDRVGFGVIGRGGRERTAFATKEVE